MRRRSGRARVRRRARELASIAEQRYIAMMEAELQAKTLEPHIIDWWEPATSARVKQLLGRVRGDVDLALGVTEILFPVDQGA